MSIADELIELGPFRPGQATVLTAAELNALREELLEGRRLKAARDRFTVFGWTYEGPDLSIACACGWESAFDKPDAGSAYAALAELVRRADEHGEACSG